MPRMNKIGKTATRVSRDANGTLRVIYHSTAVVTVDADGKITLDHGGYRSYTTKTRMNQAANEFSLGFCVSQSDHAWYVHVDGKEIPFDDHRRLVIRDPAADALAAGCVRAFAEVFAKIGKEALARRTLVID